MEMSVPKSKYKLNSVWPGWLQVVNDNPIVCETFFTLHGRHQYSRGTLRLWMKHITQAKFVVIVASWGQVLLVPSHSNKKFLIDGSESVRNVWVIKFVTLQVYLDTLKTPLTWNHYQDAVGQSGHKHHNNARDSSLIVKAHFHLFI